MKSRLYLISLFFFLATFAYDLIVWGAVPLLPEVGAGIVESAHREAPLASTYIAIGSYLDGAFPALQAFGADRFTAALGDNLARIREDLPVAMDLIFNTTVNSQHRWLKTLFWAAPILLILTVVLWVRRPRQIRVVGRR